MRELDLVRLKETINDHDAYLGDPVTVQAGALGTIVGEYGDGADIEFILKRDDGSTYWTVLTLKYDLVEPVSN